MPSVPCAYKQRARVSRWRRTAREPVSLKAAPPATRGAHAARNARARCRAPAAMAGDMRPAARRRAERLGCMREEASRLRRLCRPRRRRQEARAHRLEARAHRPHRPPSLAPCALHLRAPAARAEGCTAHRQGAALAQRLRERLMREPASLPPRRRAHRPLASPAQPLLAHLASARRQQAAMHSCGERRNTFAPRPRGAPLRAATHARTRGVLAGARHACCACRKRVRGAPGGRHSACSLGRRGALGGGGGARRAHARRAACGRVKAADARRGCARRGSVQGARREILGHCAHGVPVPADGDALLGPRTRSAIAACANAALP